MEHPFPYVGSGTAAARKSMELWVCFRDAVPEAERSAIQAALPEVVNGYIKWFDRVLVFGNGDDSLQWIVRAAYDHVTDDSDPYPVDDEMPSDAMWKAFNADIDTWLLGVHAKHPVSLFVKPIDEEYSTDTNAWHDWSCERIPSAVLPVFGALEKKHERVATYLAQMWRMWAEAQPFERQQALLAALDDAARADLAKREALFTPEAAPPPPVVPSLDECERLWRQCEAELQPSPRGMRLEDAFTAKLIERGFDHNTTLSTHRQALAKQNRHAQVAVLCRAALASGVEFPTHWYPPLVDALVAQGSLAEAAVELAHVVGTLESYSSNMLTTAMRYHRAARERAVEAVLYHAGTRWFSSFNYSFNRTEAKRFGAAPPDVAEQFAAWFIRWCGPLYFDLDRQSRFGHFLVWFDKVGTAAFGEWPARFAAHRDRWVALRDELYAAKDAGTAAALVEQLLPISDVEDAAAAFHTIRTFAPVAAYRFLAGTIRNERRSGYRSASGRRVDAIVSLMYLALNTPELADQLDEAYAIARGYLLVNNTALHFNLACCAARLERRADALGHVARSLALDFPTPQQIHDDNDLESLRGDPAFEQIFVSDAERRVKAAAAAAAAPVEETDDDEPYDDGDDLYDVEDVADDDVLEERPAKKSSAKKPADKKSTATKRTPAKKASGQRRAKKALATKAPTKKAPGKKTAPRKKAPAKKTSTAKKPRGRKR